ncbi:MAG: phosphate-selective porin OprO and OprP [Blastocatellia bacterium]
MKLQTICPRFPLLGVLIILMGSFVSARAQSASEPAGTSQPPETKQAAKPEGENGEVKQLKSQVEKLQQLLEQQPRARAEMQKRVDDLSSARAAPVVTTKPDGTAVVSSDLRTASLETSPAAKPAPAQAQAKTPDKPIVVAGWDQNHAFLRSADGRFETQISGYAQFDYRGYASGNHPANTFLVRRARLSAEGRLARYFDFKVEGDFADTSSTLLRDFYVNIHRIDEFQLRFGQFKEPYSQEELRSDIYQDFVERSLVNNLAPSRSPGLMASGVLNKGVFEYQIGSFNGKGLLALNNNNTPESVARLRFAPWKNGGSFWGKGLAFGGAYAQGRSLGGTSVRGLTESRSFTYFTPDTVNGKITRANGELTWTLGPATIRAEYDQTNQARDNLGTQGRNLPGVVAKGYMAQATYLLTGESKPDAGPVTPKHNLFGDETNKTGWGAWELKFRFSDLQIADGTAKSNRAQTMYFGPNWYLNRYVKYLLDVGFERYKDPLRSPNPSDRNYFVILSRVQVVF